MQKYRVKFELVSTAYGYVEAENEDAAGTLAMELWGYNQAFADGIMGDAEGETVDIVAIDDIDPDSVAYRAVECYTEEDIR